MITRLFAGSISFCPSILTLTLALFFSFLFFLQSESGEFGIPVRSTNFVSSLEGGLRRVAKPNRLQVPISFSFPKFRMVRFLFAVKVSYFRFFW